MRSIRSWAGAGRATEQLQLTAATNCEIVAGAAADCGHLPHLAGASAWLELGHMMNGDTDTGVKISRTHDNADNTFTLYSYLVR